MKLVAFRVQMYRNFLDSGWVRVEDLTAVVGKNESGKTSLLKALHKFNPFKPEPYSIDREWPRGHRKERSDATPVCTARFELDDDERTKLAEITTKSDVTFVEVSRDYAGRLEVISPPDVFTDRVHPNEIDQILGTLPAPPGKGQISDSFRAAAEACLSEARRLAHEGRFTDLTQIKAAHVQKLQACFSPGDPQPLHANEQQFHTQYQAKLGEVEQKLKTSPSIRKKAHEYVVSKLPTIIYMSDYKAFNGTAQLDQVKQRKDRQLTDEDQTLLTIMELAGLELDKEVTRGNATGAEEREQRQFDLSDAGATLTRTIEDRWRQRRYVVDFRADGQFFYTFVRDDRDPSLIRLEERSKGFQWFFSFDLMFMYESKGTFKNCVILLDEPGLHLHPDAQKDLLRRLEAYAEKNTLIYSTHLPFMLDLRHPSRLRVVSESDKGTVVSDDLNSSQPEGKFVIQAALGMSGSTSYLVSQWNLVVEGVDDFWYLTELSNALARSGEEGLPEHVFITPAGGASEVAYVATFMIGQDLRVAVLLDSDTAGDQAKDALVKKWLARYKSAKADVMQLGDVLGRAQQEVSIEDLFPDDFYLDRAATAYAKELAAHGGRSALKLQGSGQLVKRVERAFAQLQVPFNKGRVANVLRKELASMDATSLPTDTASAARKVFQRIRQALPAS